MVPKFVLIHTQFEFLTDKTVMKNNICAKIRSYILYLLLLTICYRTFGFTLDIRIKVHFNLLRFISTPYNRSLTCAWFNLRYK